MKSIRFVFLAVSLLGITCIRAQGINLRLDSASLALLPSIVHAGETDTIMITIHNDSASSFTGNINIGGLVDSSSVVADTTLGHTFCYPTANAFEVIPGGGSITRSLVVTVNTPPFVIGSSGVVIWPIATGSANLIHITDSISKTILVFYPLSVNNVDERDLRVFISGQQLIIYENDQNLLKSVKIFNPEGRLLQEQPISVSGIINLSQFASGVYFAEIDYADSSRKVVKLLKAK